MSKVSIDGKYFEVKIKHRWTRKQMVEDLCKKGIKIGVEELNEYIYKNFPEDAEKIARKLDKNESMVEKGMNKKKKRQRRNGHKAIKNTEVVATPELENIELEDTAENIVENIEQEETTTSVVEDTETLLEKLRAEKEEAERIIEDKEKERKAIISKRDSLIKKLIKDREIIEKWLKEIEIKEIEINETITVINEYESSIANLSKDISDETMHHEEVSLKIEELEKVTILVFEDGSIEINGIVEVEFPEEWNKLFEKLVANEEYEEFKAKHLRQVAKVLAFVAKLDKKYELLFENEDLQQSFATTKN